MVCEGSWKRAGKRDNGVMVILSLELFLDLLPGLLLWDFQRLLEEAMGRGDGWFSLFQVVFLGFWKNMVLFAGGLFCVSRWAVCPLTGGQGEKVRGQGFPALPFMFPVGLQESAFMRKQGKHYRRGGLCYGSDLVSLATLIGNAGRIHDETVSAMVLHARRWKNAAMKKKINVRDVEQFFKEHRGLWLRFTTFGISIQEKGEKKQGRANGENWGKQIEMTVFRPETFLRENYSDSRGDR